MVSIKSKEEIEVMRKAGRIAEKVLDDFGSFIKTGITTRLLDSRAKEIIETEGGTPAFKGYKGYPGNICTSINEVVVHGIPKNEVLKSEDIISVDVGVRYNGYYSDSARTYAVGDVKKSAQRLMDVTKESLCKGISQARAEGRLSDISHAIQSYVESHGYSVVRALVGHGIGSKIHENPEVPNYGEPNKGIVLKPGMTLAIEPMVNEGTYAVEVLEDGWTIVTKDRKLSAHFEHTVLITENGPEILTEWRKKKQ